jgi:hypothetical protein
LTVHSPRPNRWLHDRKGYSGLIATIFMVLVVIYLYTSVFSVIQDQNLNFQDATSQSQQIDADRNAEKITISDVTYSPDQITFTIKNNGPIPVQIVRLWAQNSTETAKGYALPMVLASGKVILDLNVEIVGVPTGDVNFWLVTSRGNLFSTDEI